MSNEIPDTGNCAGSALAAELEALPSFAMVPNETSSTPSWPASAIYSCKKHIAFQPCFKICRSLGGSDFRWKKSS
jgi:hypothetical protein